MVFSHQSITILSGILHHCTCRPLTTSANRLISTLQRHLTWKLVHGRSLRISILHRIHYRLTDEQRTIFRILCPPLHQCLIISYRMTYLPVYLRNVIVYPTFTGPKKHISIKIIIVLQTIGLTTQRITLLITVNTKRRNTELNPRLQFAHCLMNFLYQHIDITATPIRFIRKSTAITGKAGIIREVYSLFRIRVEIIIHMNSINIVAGNNIRNHHTDVATAFRQCRVEIDLVTVSNKPFGMDIINMARRQFILQ